MKKLFISCPMKGRTEENIRKTMDKMHKIAEAMFEQELEVIPSYIEDNPTENTNEAVWYLGKSIQLLSEADYYIGVDCLYFFNGCMVENEVAREYGIEYELIRMNIAAPDVVECESFLPKVCG